MKRIKNVLAPYFHKTRVEAGCDEAGRGCLAGPVFASAVILPKGFHHALLNDSKQLSELDRDILRPIIEAESISWSVKRVNPKMIDQINILNASFRAMHLAVKDLTIQPEHLIIDGNRFTDYPGIPHTCIIKGDAKYMAIAAASVLAKTHRDEYMKKISVIYPQFHWESNKGYPTQAHRQAVILHGRSVHHRKTFNVSPPQINLFKKD